MNQKSKTSTIGEWLIIGVDPGKKGAYSILNERREIITAQNFGDLADFIADYNAIKEAHPDCKSFAIIEKLGAMPIRGSIGNFKLGENFGAWQGVFYGLRIPFELVTPRRWQRTVLDFLPKGRENVKEAVVNYVKRIYPKIHIPHKKDWDMADAICLAIYGTKRLPKRIK